MLSVKFILDHKDQVAERLKIKNFSAGELLNRVIDLDQRRRSIQQQLDAELAELNNLSRSIGQLIKDGLLDEANNAKSRTAQIKENSKNLKEEHQAIEKELFDVLIQIPNLPHVSVPPGKGEDDNEEIRSTAISSGFDKLVKAHWELAADYDLIDF